jgi:hypothetical protein
MEPRDSFARTTARNAHNAAAALKQDMAALWIRLGVVEHKTAGIAKLGRCGLCGASTKGRYCAAHIWAEGGEE